MRVEIDISLENPTETIDLTLVKKVVYGSNNYEVLQYRPNNYLLLQNIYEDFKIRVHEDGRIYLKTDIDLKEDISKKNDLKNLLKKLMGFLDELHFINQGFLKNEMNFSFYGSAAHSVFWKKYNELNQIGKEALISYDLRTYTHTDDSINVKLESSNPININACCAK